MKRRLISLLLACSCLGGIAMDVRAEDYHGEDGWTVSFTAENAMESNFRTADMDDAVSGLQPGDSITFELDLKNENQDATDWYMTNKVLYSLEDRSANSDTAGGAYTYVLVYKDHMGAETVLFSSDTVGGENTGLGGEGLHGATGVLDDYFYLDTLASGQTGNITLVVALDGETQGNDYQDTLADLQMNFAVELNVTPADEEVPGEPTRRTKIVRTSDESDLGGLFIAMTVSGLLLLAMAIYSLRQGRKEKKGVE
ncbi:MAG TPA: hypothetical protein DCZ91_06270 [Lachnospiraceae bacterium]|nr:hypothetical protein [Lachnospiraceae bacterium]